MSDTKTLRDSVKDAVTEYFSHLEGEDAKNLYKLFMGAVEKPLLERVMQIANGNQSQAARWLGLSRNTLRKMLEEHKLLRNDIEKVSNC